MPTLPLPSHSAPKGVRRPFGNINVNRTGAANKQNKANKKDGKNVTKTVIKPTATSAFTVVSKQEKNATSNDGRTLDTLKDNRQETFEAAQVQSVFRRVPSEDSVTEQMNLLSLQLATPIDDKHDEAEQESSSFQDADKAIYLPFTRADGCFVVEPVSTQSVRSIFRKSDNSGRDEMFALRRANPIVNDDSSDDDESDVAADQPAPSDSAHTGSLFPGQGHVLENMTIMDFMTM